MTYAVVFVQRPQGAVAHIQGAWPSFSGEVSQLKLPAGKNYRPSDHVWLLDLSSASGVLASVVATAQMYEIPHRILYFDSLPLEYSYPSSTP